MAIKSLTIQNFKGIGSKQIIPLLPITLLFGPNSAGKSTVLHALNYLNDLVNRFDASGGNGQHGSAAMDLGGFLHFVHKHEKTRAISISAEMDLAGEDLYEARVNRSYRQLFEAASPDHRRSSGLADLTLITARIFDVTFSFEIAWGIEVDAPLIRRLDIQINGAQFASLECSDDSRAAKISALHLDHSIFRDEDVEGWKAVARTAFSDRFFSGDGSAVISLAGTKQAIPDWRIGLEFGDVWQDLSDDESGTQITISALLNCIICGSLEALARELEGLRYVGPLRDIPARTRRAQRQNAAWGAGIAAWDLVAADPVTRSAVNVWLDKDHLDLGYELVSQPIIEIADHDSIMPSVASEPLDKYKRLLLRDTTRQVDVYPHDVGIGVSQLVPVVVGALARESKILAVEQPELHIHPRLQIALGDLFVHAAEQRKTLILETHSEHLMLRLLRRIRESSEDSESMAFPLRAEELQVLYVECVDGETRISPLRVSDSGRFVDRWPHGFFDERFEEQ